MTKHRRKPSPESFMNPPTDLPQIVLWCLIIVVIVVVCV
jgi:hypothetical protein